MESRVELIGKVEDMKPVLLKKTKRVSTGSHFEEEEDLIVPG